uniref:antiviral reverse transcriptase Drt3a n=1 Tax=Yoonia sp. TaxID=2212373 RepID=UPI0040472D3C
MLDQTFSPENLQIISDIEKRRGRVPDLGFFPSVKDKTDILRDRISDIKSFRSSHKGKYSQSDQAIFDQLCEDRESARQDRDRQLLLCLRDVSERISRKSYVVQFAPTLGPNGKTVFTVPNGVPDHYYALKQLSHNINRIYKVKQADRNRIISQLADYLSDKFPYHILRTDVAEFFENIDHSQLLQKVKEDQLLSQTSLRLIENILYTYGQLSGTPGKGIPRGVGISAYLSELFMRDFDSAMIGRPDVVFYARFVDDIVVVFAPTPTSMPSSYLPETRELLKRKKLLINAQKTIESPLTVEGLIGAKAGWSFEYLGYRFTTGQKLQITLSDSKIKKYHDRLSASFFRYHSQRANDAKGAYRLLMKRVRYLSGNTQLTHSKKNAFVGIYFSNPNLNELGQLKDLDGQLSGFTAGIGSVSLKLKLSKLSFLKGYEQKIFRRFHREDEFREIVRAWKYGK